ncbi:hypothetical protein NLG97_g5751 [Lecanicillium saksenae]|uniref:Uncharacterized protein n=1 Tax=Lecanicillium saksenae TaxID=468837 RepID=A0ACC1QT88_9HYPO|nr:hypothetical protein NLG97_g5751 [Lecanicillium saksenae]
MKFSAVILGFAAVVSATYNSCERSADCKWDECCVLEDSGFKSCHPLAKLHDQCSLGGLTPTNVYSKWCPCHNEQVCRDGACLQK